MLLSLRVWFKTMCSSVNDLCVSDLSLVFYRVYWIRPPNYFSIGDRPENVRDYLWSALEDK